MLIIPSFYTNRAFTNYSSLDRRRTPFQSSSNLHKHPPHPSPSHILPRTPSNPHHPRLHRLPFSRPSHLPNLFPRHGPGGRRRPHGHPAWPRIQTTPRLRGGLYGLQHCWVGRRALVAADLRQAGPGHSEGPGRRHQVIKGQRRVLRQRLFRVEGGCGGGHEEGGQGLDRQQSHAQQRHLPRHTSHQPRSASESLRREHGPASHHAGQFDGRRHRRPRSHIRPLNLLRRLPARPHPRHHLLHPHASPAAEVGGVVGQRFRRLRRPHDRFRSGSRSRSGAAGGYQADYCGGRSGS